MRLCAANACSLGHTQLHSSSGLRWAVDVQGQSTGADLENEDVMEDMRRMRDREGGVQMALEQQQAEPVSWRSPPACSVSQCQTQCQVPCS